MPPGYTAARVTGCGPGARELWSAVVDEHERTAPHQEPRPVAEVFQTFERSAYLAFDPAAIGPSNWLGPPLVLLAGSGFDGPLATRIDGPRNGGFDATSIRQGASCRFRRGAGAGAGRPYVLAVGDALDLELPPAVLSATPAEPPVDFVDRSMLTPASPTGRRAERAVKLLVEAGAEDGLGWLPGLDDLLQGTSPTRDLAALIDGWTAVLQGRSPRPPTDLLGRGPGATPSGDDILAGTLLALDRPTAGAEHDRVRAAGERLVDVATDRTTTVSAALLAQAVQGRAAGRIDAALVALLGRDNTGDDLDRRIRDVTDVGHTSGVDLLVGALLVPLAIGPRVAATD